MRLHGPISNAERAARTAASTSAASPSAIRASSSPVAGLTVGKVRSDRLSTHLLLIRSLTGDVVTIGEQRSRERGDITSLDSRPAGIGAATANLGGGSVHFSNASETIDPRLRDAGRIAAALVSPHLQV